MPRSGGVASASRPSAFSFSSKQEPVPDGAREEMSGGMTGLAIEAGIEELPTRLSANVVGLRSCQPSASSAFMRSLSDGSSHQGTGAYATRTESVCAFGAAQESATPSSAHGAQSSRQARTAGTRRRTPPTNPTTTSKGRAADATATSATAPSQSSLRAPGSSFCTPRAEGAPLSTSRTRPRCASPRVVGFVGDRLPKLQP